LVPLPIFLVPVFIHIFNPYLLHGPFGMAEDRIQHQFLSWDQFIHIGLGVVIEYGPGTRPKQVFRRRRCENVRAGFEFGL
jgi:hypothetical protein